MSEEQKDVPLEDVTLTDGGDTAVVVVDPQQDDAQPDAEPEGETAGDVETVESTEPPDDHLCSAVCSAVCCCPIIGIFAIINSVRTKRALQSGDMVLAKAKSKYTKKLAVAGAIVGFLIYTAGFYGWLFSIK